MREKLPSLRLRDPPKRVDCPVETRSARTVAGRRDATRSSRSATSRRRRVPAAALHRFRICRPVERAQQMRCNRRRSCAAA